MGEKTEHTDTVYGELIEFVDGNTGGRFPLITETATVTSVYRSISDDFHPSAVRSAIAEACACGDLFRWADPRSTTAHLGIDDASELEAKIAARVQAARVTESSARQIQAARQRIQNLRGETHER